jgi:aminoglycoside phosphotransferase (APT) family kinase protein
MPARPPAERADAMAMTTTVPTEFAQALQALGLAGAEGGEGDGVRPLQGEALTGGVSSDIWRIDTGRGPLCAKRALPKLRVAADWFAPVERSRYEARWMQVAGTAVPGHVPRLLGQHADLGVLVMDFLPPADHRLWKAVLRTGTVELACAREVGRLLGRIHAYAAARPALAAEFDSQDIFFDIRLEPYLLATARRHPGVAPALQQLVQVTQANARTLVHGDVSPKNILIGPRGPVLLDAECAVWSDPAFDLAFCLNHLLLKCLWTPSASAGFLAAFEALAASYLKAVDWEPPAALEQRAARLLPGLLLARVDGKSPVEYLTRAADHEVVRRAATALLRQPVARLGQVAAAWQRELQG